MRMKNAVGALFLAVLLHTNPLRAQNIDSVPIVGFEYVQQLMQQKNDTTYVINFWATWCKPCIQELPHFTSLQAHYPDKKLKVILVSLDFKKNYQTALLPYLKKNNIITPVVLLYEPDANSWIEKVDKNWSGAIPATLIFNKTKSSFFEQDFEETELHTTVESFL